MNLAFASLLASTVAFVFCCSISITGNENWHSEPQEKNTLKAESESEIEIRLRPDAKLGGVVRAVFEDSKGVLWIGGEGDLFKITPDLVTSYDLRDRRNQRTTVKQIVEATDGTIWCGTTGGISKIQDDSFVSLGEEDGLPNQDVWSLAADKNGGLWIGTIAGVFRYDGKKFEPFNIPKSQPDWTRGVTSAEIVHCIMVDSKQRVWFGTNGGAYIYDGKELLHLGKEDGLPDEVVHNLAEDPNGDIWIGTTHNGLCRYDGKAIESFTEINAGEANTIEENTGVDNTGEGDEIWSLHAGSDGTMWFSGKHLGVNKYADGQFEHFGKSEGMDSPGMMAGLEDSQGRQWFGGVGGLFRFQDGKFIKVSEQGPWR